MARTIRLAHDLDDLAIRIAHREAWGRSQHRERQADARRGLDEVYRALAELERAIERAEGKVTP
jgi:hypothetical protein